MATIFKIVTAHEFLEITADGIIDLATSRKLFADIAGVVNLDENQDLLVDFRGTESKLTITDVYQLAAELIQHGTSFRRKVALVVTPGLNFNRASFFVTCSDIRGFSVKAYTDFEAAMRWILKAQKPDKHPSIPTCHI
ncbi:MAG: hypothetical protein PHF56_18450 [Desulfuromonadaceae bacterium]|nr:hypothetical protein [Desulfuromonadaceae bacterium]